MNYNPLICKTGFSKKQEEGGSVLVVIFIVKPSEDYNCGLSNPLLQMCS